MSPHLQSNPRCHQILALSDLPPPWCHQGVESPMLSIESRGLVPCSLQCLAGPQVKASQTPQVDHSPVPLEPQ